MNTPEIDAATAELAAATAEVERLQARLRAARDDQAARGHSGDDAPRRDTAAADGVMEARRRAGMRTAPGTGTAREDFTHEDTADRTADAGRAEARRRAAARGTA